MRSDGDVAASATGGNSTRQLAAAFCSCPLDDRAFPTHFYFFTLEAVIDLSGAPIHILCVNCDLYPL
jgi:hypothetical protein